MSALADIHVFYCIDDNGIGDHHDIQEMASNLWVVACSLEHLRGFVLDNAGKLNDHCEAIAASLLGSLAMIKAMDENFDIMSERLRVRASQTNGQSIER